MENPLMIFDSGKLSCWDFHATTQAKHLPGTAHLSHGLQKEMGLLEVILLNCECVYDTSGIVKVQILIL